MSSSGGPPYPSHSSTRSGGTHSTNHTRATMPSASANRRVPQATPNGPLSSLTPSNPQDLSYARSPHQPHHNVLSSEHAARALVPQQTSIQAHATPPVPSLYPGESVAPAPSTRPPPQPQPVYSLPANSELYNSSSGRLHPPLIVNPVDSASASTLPTQTLGLALSAPPLHHRHWPHGSALAEPPVGAMWPESFQGQPTTAIAYHPAYNHLTFGGPLHTPTETTFVATNRVTQSSEAATPPQTASQAQNTPAHTPHPYTPPIFPTPGAQASRRHQVERDIITSFPSTSPNPPLLQAPNSDRLPYRTARGVSASPIASPIPGPVPRTPAIGSRQETRQLGQFPLSNTGSTLQVPTTSHRRAHTPGPRTSPVPPSRSPSPSGSLRRSLPQLDDHQSDERPKRRRLSHSEESREPSISAESEVPDGRMTRKLDITFNLVDQPQPHTQGPGKNKSTDGCLTCRARRKRCTLILDERRWCSECIRLKLICLRGYGKSKPKEVVYPTPIKGGPGRRSGTGTQRTRSNQRRVGEATTQHATVTSNSNAHPQPQQPGPSGEQLRSVPHPSVPPIGVTPASPSPTDHPLPPDQPGSPYFYAHSSQPSTPASTISYLSTDPPASPVESWTSSAIDYYTRPPTPGVDAEVEPSYFEGLRLITGPTADDLAGSSRDTEPLPRWDDPLPATHGDDFLIPFNPSSTSAQPAEMPTLDELRNPLSPLSLYFNPDGVTGGTNSQALHEPTHDWDLESLLSFDFSPQNPQPEP
ncbi:hypothetical protein DL93DRAFT_578552 [Clavulina sp. PMI_390]|nr:hypothetical protein DL93DRAFT_578552 [Clavulina sp. PMI_390]